MQITAVNIPSQQERGSPPGIRLCAARKPFIQASYTNTEIPAKSEIVKFLPIIVTPVLKLKHERTADKLSLKNQTPDF